MISRLLRAAALAALALAAVPARAQAGAVPLPPPPSGTALLPRGAPAPDGFRLGAILGVSFAGGRDGDPVLRVDGVLPLATTPNGVAVGAVLPVRLVYQRTVHDVNGMSLEASPSVRLGFPVSDRIAVRADTGLGLVHGWAWQTVDVAFVGKRSETHESTDGIFRFTLALDFVVANDARIVLEPMSVGYGFKGGAEWSILTGATFRM